MVPHCFLALLFLSALTGAALAEPPPLETYAALPEVAEAVLSPDGKRIAVLRNHRDGTSRVVVAEVDSGKLFRAVQMPVVADLEVQDRIYDVSWIDEQRLGYLIKGFRPFTDPAPDYKRFPSSIPGVWKFRTTLLNLLDGKSTMIHETTFGERLLQLSHLIPPFPGEPGIGRVKLYERDYGGGTLNIRQVDLSTGIVGKRLVSGNGDSFDFAIQPNGNPGLRLDFDPQSELWSVYDISQNKSGARALKEPMFSGSKYDLLPISLGYTADGQIVLATRFKNNDKSEVRAFRHGDSLGTVLASDPARDIRTLIHDPWNHTVVGAEWLADRLQQSFFDAELDQARRQLEALFPTGDLDLRHWSQDRARIIVAAAKAGTAGALFLFEPESGKLTHVGEAYPKLNPAEFIGQRLSTHYPGRGGERIPAIVTLPGKTFTGPRPLIVMGEGYAVWESSTSFYWLAAYFASRGYVVIEPASRGKVGFGRQWMDAAHQRWLQTGVEDLEDAAHALVKSGLAAPDKICGLGFRETGVLMALAATRPHSPFDCTVTINAPLDLPDFWNTLRREVWMHNLYRRSLEDMFGKDASSQRKLRAVSPVHQADSIRGPMLVVASLSTRTPYQAHATAMKEAIEQSNGKAAGRLTYVDLNTADETLEQPTTRLRVLKALDEFLKSL